MKKILTIVFFLSLTFVFSQENKKSKYGLKLPSQKYLDSLPREVFIPKKTISLPKSIDLSSSMPTPGNQGNQPSCTAWALGYGLKTYQEREELNNPNLLFSPTFIYNTLQWEDSDCDEGVSFFDAFNRLKEYGTCEWSFMGYDDGKGKCNIQPLDEAVENAYTYRIEDWKVIYADTAHPIYDLQKIKKSIYNNRPVAIAVWLDSSIAGYMDDFTLNKPKFVWNNPLNDTDKSEFYHAMLCVGYDDVKEEFKVLNSYGPNSGDNGYIHISYEAFKRAVYEAYYAIDLPNNGKYVSAKKLSKAKSDLGFTDTDFNFYGWLKKGYYIKITEKLKVSCSYLNKSKNVVVLRLYDTSLGKEKMIGSYKFSEGDAYDIKYLEYKFKLKLDRIGAAGKNIFKSAAFIEFSSY